jgi:hypothetical protein
MQDMTSSAGQFAANTPQHLQSLSTGLNQTAAGVTAVGQSAATLTSAAQGAVQANKGVYDMVQAHVAATQGKSGGGAFTGGYFGGDSTDEPSKALKEYRDSLAAATKDRIVRGLARALSRAGIDVNPDASAEEIARALQGKLPNPRKGKTFAADAKAQEKVCRTIADVLNDEFTPGAKKSDRLIDTSLGAVSVCRQVAEIVHSLSTGLHTEFLEVHASLTRVLRNLEVLDEVLSELHSKIGSQVRSAELPTGADKKIADFEEVYSRAQRERERQMSMLRNFLSVTLAPAKEELAIAMRDEGEAHDMIKRLKLVPGTGDFADSLASAVSGLGTVAAVSARVDKALQDVGLSVQQYLSSADMSTLEQTLDSKLMTSGEVDADDIGKFLKAVQTLKENFYRRSELDFGAASDAEMVAEIAGSYEGGRRGRGYRGGADSTLDKRVEKRKVEKKLIVKEFIDKSTRQYDALLKAVQVLGPQLGKSIPLSDKLESLRNALANLGQVRMGALSLELALLGFYGDAGNRQKKENFLSGLRVVQGILDELMSMEMYRRASQYFAAMRAAIDGLVRTIDFYSDVIAKKYGSGDFPDEEVTGGDDYDLSSIPEIARSSYDLERAINTFLYFYYVAKVRSNLAQTHKELEYYGEKYVDILGDAVAARLRQLEGQKAEALKTGSAAQKTFVENEYACKANFYRALQALDLYMKAFTDGIVAHPDDVADVKRMLDGVSVIGRWFIEDTGDDLAEAFDMMPAWDGAAQQATALGGGAHYYEKVATAANASNDLFKAGVPQLAIPVDRADAVRKQVAKVYDNFQALKNITNAFVRVGDKFGGKELRRMVFMSPTQMYKAFLEYLKCSALSMGNLGAPAGPPAPPVGRAAPVALAAPAVPLTDNAGGALPVPAAAGALADTGVYFGSTLPGLEGSYCIEDQYFTFCVKAMAAKVLTVIGVFDLFERPSPVYELTPTRMIIGGADYDSVPEVIPEASELYFRLPRLAEFYKDLFKPEGAQTWISMLPEMEGTFSGIIRLIFNRVEGGAARSGDYSDLEVRQIVREVNSIYENFRGSGKGSAISEALSAFVMEINRRYGLVKKKDWDQLQQLLKNERRAVQGGPQGTQTNYAILPGEEEYESDRRAPSDRYLGPGAAAGDTALSSKFDIDGKMGCDDWAQWMMLKDFREKLDRKFASVNPDEFTAYSFSAVIRQGELEMRRAEGASAKIGVAARLIQGSGNLAGIDVGKSFMFHETVVVGLNTLSAIYTLLNAFKQRVIDTDVTSMRELLATWAQTPAAAGAAINYAALTAGAGPLQDLTDQARSYVRTAASGLGRWGGAPEAATANALYAAVEATRGALPGGGVLGADVAQTLATYCLDDSRMLRDLLMVVTGLTTTFQGLVTARFPGTAAGQIHLDFSGLRGLIQGLVSDVRYFLDLFRPHIAKSVINRYEDRNNEGSLYWLEENLLDGLVSGLPDSDPGDQRVRTLEWVSRKINQSYATLVGYNRYNLTALAGGALVVTDTGDAALPAAANPASYGQYGNMLCAMVFYDAAADANSGVVAGGAAIAASGLNALISTVKPRVAVAGGAPAAVMPPTGVGAAANRRIMLWNDMAGGLQDDRSMIFSFNQLLAKYIGVFYDSASGKIYRNLIDGFANGSFSRAVMTPGNTMPDLANNVRDNFGVRGDPTNAGVLCESLGLILQRLATDISPSTQISDHLVATLSEIPLYIRESYRANLPGFIKLFELVQQQGEFLKQLMAQTAIQVGRWVTPRKAADVIRAAGGAAALASPADDGAVVQLTAANTVDRTAMDTYPVGSAMNSITPLLSCPGDSAPVMAMLVQVIDGIAAGCYSISNAAAEVLREIADEPLYLQTQENSIQEYKARYGKMPLMPLSSVLTFLRNLNGSNDDRLFPEHSAGDQTFKFMYGTRKLLGRPTSKFSLADAPGVRANLEAYNSSASGREKVDSARVEQFLTNAISCLRFVVDTRYYRGILAPVEPAGLAANVGGVSSILRVNLTGAGTGIITAGNDANAAYAVRVSPQDALAVTESSYQDQEMKKISDVIGGSVVTLGQDRSREWIYNIIDMNIIPINVHALMRGIPLAPLYNYVFTFEQMACLMLGETVGHVGSLDFDPAVAANPAANPPVAGGVHNTRQMFLKLMLNPYAELNTQAYGNTPRIHPRGANGLVGRIFRGDDSLMMGRPKFLSDQVYNKALFGSLVPSPYDLDETGPPGAGRMTSGYTMTSANIGAADAAGLVVPPVRATWADAAGADAQRAAAVPAVRLPANAVADNRRGYFALTYIGQPDAGNPATALKVVQLGNNTANKMVALEAVGKARFDTRIVRNLFFISNIQRLMRLKLNQELTQYRNVLVSNHSVVNPGVTEYGYMPPTAATMRDAQNRQVGIAAQASYPGTMETARDREYDSDRRLVQ